MSTPRVLSIQSHVVFGYVGNKSATFPLQLLGFEVDCINSVQLSNHTGYKSFSGQVLNEDDLNKLISGLKENGLEKGYTHLLTGYVRNESFLQAIVNVVGDLKRANPELIYVCDPVMGDDGELYVPEELVPIYRDRVIPLADIITPNQTELEFLTGEKANTLENALKCIQILHDKGCKTVVVSSIEFVGSDDFLFTVASYISPSNSKKQVMIKIPKLRANFFGTGDLFAATFLAWMSKLNNNLCNALENTVATVSAVITRTLNNYKSCSGDNCERRELELKLIQSKNDIENPKIIHSCSEIEI